MKAKEAADKEIFEELNGYKFEIIHLEKYIFADNGESKSNFDVNQESSFETSLGE